MEHPRLVRIAELERKLKARTSAPGYETNCEHLRTQIANFKAAHDDDLARQAGDYRL